MEPPRELLLTLLQHPSHILTEEELSLLWKYLCPWVDDLVTVDGRTVEILQRGDVGHPSGPDVRNVQVSLDGVLRTGDVEIHRQTSDWYHHEHHQDRAFNTVVLHLVLTGEPASVRREDDHWVDTLVLEDYLEELKRLLESVSDSSVADRRKRVKRPCFREEPKSTQIQEKLDDVGEVWLAGQASKFRDSASNRWLMELIGALGYTRNHENFRRIGRRLELDRFQENVNDADSTAQLEGYLLGIGGWFDGRNGTMNSSIYRRRRHWRRTFREETSRIENSGSWSTAGVRPHARPVRRWILFGWATRHLLNRELTWKLWLKQRLPNLLKTSDDLQSLRQEFQEIFDLPTGNYWSYHYSLSDHVHDSVPLALGTNWFDQVIMNLVLPYGYYQGISRGDREMVDRVRTYLRSFPARLNNRRTRRIQEQWGFEDRSFEWENGYRQQASVYLYKKGCKQNRCGRCPLNQSGEPDQAGLFEPSR